MRKCSYLDGILLSEWTQYLREFNKENGNGKSGYPAAMRCENTQLTTGWRCGGFTLNGTNYVSLCPEGAMLAVSDDLIAWVKRRRSDERAERKHKAEEAQGTLGI